MRRLPRYLVSGVHFTTACVLLFLLMPRRTAAYRQRNFSSFRTFNAAVDFGTDREHLEAYMRQHTRSFCTCSNDILQSRFCKQDFVIMARRTSTEPRTFYRTSGPKLLHFGGIILSLEVKQVLRGPLEENITVDFHFVQGAICGVTPSMIPSKMANFIITGFRLCFPSCDKIHHHPNQQTTQLYLVTRCSTSMPLESLSITQIAGLFLGLYSCNQESCREPRPYFWEPPQQSTSAPTCYYHYSARRCYNRFGLCTKSFLNQSICTFRAVNRIPNNPAVLAKIPPEIHTTEGTSKCFIEEVPEDTPIAGTYSIAVLQDEQFVRSPKHGVHVEVKDPEGNVVLSRMYSQEGRFVITSQTAGEYSICLSSSSSDWTKSLLEIASKEELNELELHIRQLLEQVATLAKDQDFQRAREEYFRRLSESINNRVTWWSVAQVLLLCLTGFFQMRNLRSFFLAKKLV
ncbi:Transmembrane emp24 domain-containing protein 4 [Taenia crassiceps]|uniref:Transmembrane emp24 domain-containing protein 4 n=1 Tax=Taenia crassiceps TaxID=6207 RepID=A0ABR4QH91_9CEST